MILTSKTIVLGAVATCALLGVITVVFVQGVMSQLTARTYQGYFAPVYSPDGHYVYFVERSTNATGIQTNVTDFLSAPQYDVAVAKDTFTLKRIQVANGQIEELNVLPPSPIEGKRYEKIYSPFHVPNARLKFTEGHQLQFVVCLSVDQKPSDKEYLSSGVWAGGSAALTEVWKESYCQMSGYDEWPLFGDWEVFAVRGQPFLPAAIAAYNHVTRDVRVLVKNEDYEAVYPNGVPLQYFVDNSRRSMMERDQAMRRTHKELMQKYKSTGMGEVQALLQTGKDMQRLGYYPKTPKIVAHRLDRAETVAARRDNDAFFKIAKGEMESGIFPDIEKAIARPGEEIDQSDGYHIHRDYSTSARLNKFLEAGNTRFYVEYLGNTYELTIKRP